MYDNFIVIVKSQNDFKEICDTLQPKVIVNKGINKLMKYKNGCLSPCMSHKDYMLPTLTMDIFRILKGV